MRVATGGAVSFDPPSRRRTVRMSEKANGHMRLPDLTVSAAQVFGVDIDMQVPAFSEADEHVPDIDEAYIFDRETTLALLAGFA